MLARSDLSRRRPRTERGPAAPPPRRPDPPKLRSAAPAAITATTRRTISTADIRTSAHMLRVGLAAHGAGRLSGIWSTPTLRPTASRCEWHPMPPGSLSRRLQRQGLGADEVVQPDTGCG